FQSSAKKISAYLNELGYDLPDVSHIVITHADDDHYGSLAKLQSHSAAQSYASPKEAEAIRNGTSSRSLKLNGIKKFGFWLLNRLVKAKPARIDVQVRDGQILPFLGGLQIIETPGHTPGHISVYCPSQGILFAGDSMQSDGERLSPSKGINTWDETEAISSVRKQSRLGARIVCVGHGPVIYEASQKFILPNGYHPQIEEPSL
ncbi:MAG: MBL fold metallo-hydrolase, partial [Anaerolineales bacterium]